MVAVLLTHPVWIAMPQIFTAVSTRMASLTVTIIYQVRTAVCMLIALLNAISSQSLDFLDINVKIKTDKFVNVKI